MTADDAAKWMLGQLDADGCIYQDDVVDYLVKGGAEELLRENADGNLVLGRPLLDAFKKVSATTVVWVRAGFYWRWRVAEDEDGRDAIG
ncbi:MAG: hypothetical protein K5880_17950 [Hydrogenophaga sp.]|uniref:DUF6953 family protein n=1 Tax=Hydrogenophaga sp. TaxID=1904254 RepID=UPI0026266C83|nr:hypothetical protein [Hydrogenophaga sp.]MCV0440478.1 hypothetical protein [Hydrogenophaga sp.]